VKEQRTSRALQALEEDRPADRSVRYSRQPSRQSGTDKYGVGHRLALVVEVRMVMGFLSPALE